MTLTDSFAYYNFTLGLQLDDFEIHTQYTRSKIEIVQE